MKAAIVIPARLESTRLPRKLLLAETGKCLIEHTHSAAASSELADQIVVATDSNEISDVVESFGGHAVFTSSAHKTGSDRVAEAAQELDAEIIVNLQGDEPEVSGGSIDKLIKALSNDSNLAVATLAAPIQSKKQLLDPSCVKVVFNRFGHAVYFSRSPIPAARDQTFLDSCFSDPASLESPSYFQHLGIYAYRRQFLLQIPELQQSKSEKIESLEQLRFLDYGWKIGVEIVADSAAGIDTAEDYAAFVNRWRNG